MEGTITIIFTVIAIAIDVKMLTYVKDLSLVRGSSFLTLVSVLFNLLNVITGKTQFKIFASLIIIAISFLANLITLLITRNINNTFIYILAFLIVDYIIVLALTWAFAWPLLWATIALP